MIVTTGWIVMKVKKFHIFSPSNHLPFLCAAERWFLHILYVRAFRSSLLLISYIGHYVYTVYLCIIFWLRRLIKVSSFCIACLTKISKCWSCVFFLLLPFFSSLLIPDFPFSWLSLLFRCLSYFLQSLMRVNYTLLMLQPKWNQPVAVLSIFFQRYLMKSPAFCIT